MRIRSVTRLFKWLAASTVGIALIALISMAAGDTPSTTAEDTAEAPACAVALAETPPNIGELAVDSLEMRVRWQGHSLSSYHTANVIMGTDAGRVLAIFDWRSGWPLEEIILYWNGYRLVEPIVPPTPTGCSPDSGSCQGHIYHVHVLIDAFGNVDVGVMPTERQIWWKGQVLGYGVLAGGYFDPNVCGGLTHTYLVTDEETTLVCGTTYYGGTDGPQ